MAKSKRPELDEIEMSPDGSLEGLDDIDGDVDDAWAEAVNRLVERQNKRASKERHRYRKPKGFSAIIYDGIAEPFVRYKMKRKRRRAFRP